MKNSDILTNFVYDNKDDMESYDLLDLSKQQEVLEEDFFRMYEILSDLEIEDSTFVLGCMDKLLHSDLPKANFTNGVFRDKTPLSYRSDFEEFIVFNNLEYALNQIIDNLDNISQYDCIQTVLQALLMSQLNENDLEEAFSELPKTLEFIINHRSDCVRLLDNLERLNKDYQDKVKDLDSLDEDNASFEVLKFLFSL